MYKIDSKVDKPDIKYLEDTVKMMMIRGVNVGDLDLLYARFIAEKDGLASEIKSNYGIANPNSSQQITKYLANIDNPEIYETCFIDGKWTSNKDALGNLSLIGYQFAKDILDYRKAKKYAESIKSMQDAIGSDGRVHPTVTLSKTNRINYSSPALMNIPKPLLWHIISPNKPGNILVSADIKNQEPSILINLLGIESLKEALTSKNGLYEYIFSRAFVSTARLNLLVTPSYKEGPVTNEELASLGYVPPVYYTPDPPSVVSTYYNNEQVRVIDTTSVVVKPGTKREDIVLPDKVLIETVNDNQYYLPVIWGGFNEKKLNIQGIIEVTGIIPDMEIRCDGIYRKEFKIAWNAMTYGAGSFGVEKMCKHIDGKRFYSYFSSIPEFKKYRNNCKQHAERGQQYINTFFGTTLNAGGETNAFKLQRVLMDLPIQGTAADILSMLLKNSNKVIEEKYKGKLEVYYTRHDEMIFEVDKDWVDSIGIDNVLDIIKDMTEHQVDEWTPFKVEVKELKPGKLYIDEDDSEI